MDKQFIKIFEDNYPYTIARPKNGYIGAIFTYLGGTHTMLYFIHGWLSSPTGDKALLFKQQLDATPLTYRNCAPEELIVEDAMQTISNSLEGDTEVTLIGSSIGGLMASRLALDETNIKRLILLNPAIIPPHIDLATLPTIPQQILQGMQDPRLFSEKIGIPITIFNGNNDEVVPPTWPIEFARFQEATIIFLDDDHRLTKNMNRLPDMIRALL